MSAISPRSIPPLTWIVLGGASVRLALIWTGWCDSYVLADDAFYYFTIARNLASGAGSTFDGLAPTNGYHPLYMAALLPIFRGASLLGADAWGPIRAAQTLLALTDVASGVLLFRTLSSLGLRRGAPWAAGVWLLSPLGTLVTLRGMETSLSVFFVALWLHTAARIGQQGWPTLRQAAGLGAIYGLAVLARTDNAPLMGAGLLAQGIVLGVARRPKATEAVAAAAVVGGVALAVVLPWVLWNLTVFGSPWQVSGVAKMANPGIFGALHLDRPLVARTPVLRELALIWKLLLSAVRYLAGEELWQVRLAPILGWFLAGLVLVATLLSRSVARAATPAVGAVAIGAAVYLVSHLFVYAAVLRTYVPWYAGVPVFLLSAWVPAVIAERAPSLLSRTVRVALVGLCLASLLSIYPSFLLRHKSIEPKGPERRLATVFAHVARVAPGAQTIGTFNAGCIGYFAPYFGPYRVVNLDGLVNNRAFAAWQHGRYLQYLFENVDLLWVHSPRELRAWLAGPERERLIRAYPPWPDGEFFGPRRLESIGAAR